MMEKSFTNGNEIVAVLIENQSIDDAVIEGCSHLGILRVKADVEILDKGCNGFIGIGVRKARVIVKSDSCRRIALEECDSLAVDGTEAGPNRFSGDDLENDGEREHSGNGNPDSFKKRNMWSDDKLTWFFCLGCFLFALAMSSSRVYESYHCRSWPAVTATVISAEVIKKTEPGDGLNIEQITYTYLVNGDTFSTTRRTHETLASDVEYAERYPLNSRPLVHYNPSNPSSNILETQPYGISLFVLLCAVIGLQA